MIRRGDVGRSAERQVHIMSAVFGSTTTPAIFNSGIVSAVAFLIERVHASEDHGMHLQSWPRSGVIDQIW